MLIIKINENVCKISKNQKLTSKNFRWTEREKLYFAKLSCVFNGIAENGRQGNHVLNLCLQNITPKLCKNDIAIYDLHVLVKTLEIYFISLLNIISHLVFKDNLNFYR